MHQVCTVSLYNAQPNVVKGAVPVLMGSSHIWKHLPLSSTYKKGNRKKSEAAESGEYGGWRNECLVEGEMCGEAL